MGITLGTNIASLRAQRRLADGSELLSRTFERLASGARINRASDDAAGLSIASALRADQRVFTTAVRNLNDGISALAIAENAIQALSGIVTRQAELAEQSANGVYTSEQRKSLNREAQQLSNEYARILATTEFNGRTLLDGSESRIALQAGYGENAILNATLLSEEQTDVVQTTGLGTYSDYTATWTSLPLLAYGPEFLVSDFNGDGIDDIAAIRTHAPAFQTTTSIGFFLGQDGGTTFSLEDEVTITTNYGGSLNSVSVSAALVDNGGDGDMDIEIRISVDGTTIDGTSSGRLINDLNPGGVFDMSFLGGVVNPTDETQATVNGDFNNDGVQDIVNANGQAPRFRIQDTSSTVVGSTITIQTLDQSSFSLSNQSQARDALDYFGENLTLLSNALSEIGASQSRIFSAREVVSATNQQFAAAESRVRDADVAVEAATLTRVQIMQQAAAAVLAQANQQPNIALSLLG